ncbi:MAG TPA: DUF5667 domain-containing protein [Chloroflexia bacterium]|nr:DUF5667 domain-containing protein [Chloroflexia bacterium]
MAHFTVQDALDYCLANPDGLSVAELLNRFPQYREELEPLLALGMNIPSAIPFIEPLDRAAMKQRLMNVAAARYQPAATVAAERQKRRLVLPWLNTPAWAVLASTAVLLVFLWLASSSALPGNPLYPVKLTTEDVKLNLATSGSAKLEEHLSAANTRLAELQALAREGHLSIGDTALDNYSSHISGSTGLLQQAQGQAKVELARNAFIESSSSALKLQSLIPQLGSANLQQDADEAVTALDRLRGASSAALVMAGIDPEDVARSAGLDPAKLPTTLPQVAAATATPSAPVVASAPSPTATTGSQVDPTQAAQRAEQTSVAGASQGTARVVAAQGGDPDRVRAARTVLSSGPGTAVISAQQTVLAPVVSTPTTQAAPPTRVAATQAPPPTLAPTETRRPVATVERTPPRATPSPPRPPSTPSARPQRTTAPRETPPSGTQPVPTRTRVVPPLPTNTVELIPTRRPTRTPEPPRPTATEREHEPSTPGRPATRTPVPPTAVLQPPTPPLLQTLVPRPTEIVPTATSRPPARPTETEEPSHNTPPPRPTDTPLPVVTVIGITPPPVTPPVLPTLSPPVPSVIPVPSETETACLLQVEEVELQCTQGGCVVAAALLRNEDGSPITASWTAELKYKLAAGGYITRSVQRGTATFNPGETAFQPTFCVSLPPGTTKIKVRFAVDVAHECHSEETSGAEDPCGP